MSARWKLNKKDLTSAARHTVVPLLGGAAVAGVEALQSGGFDLGQAKTAAVSAFAAGVIRLLHRWVQDLAPPSSGA